MVLTTITTIGYGEIYKLSTAGRVFNTFIIIAGVGLVLLFFGAATQALLEFELQSVFGRRRMDREISRLSNHYIICGAGRVGRSVARELARKPLPFVIVDSDEASWRAIPIKAGSRWSAMPRRRRFCASFTLRPPRTGRRHYDRRDQHLHHPDRAQPEPDAQDHCPRQRGRRREAPAHRRRRSRRLALQLRRLSHCADLHAPACRGFLRHRHEPGEAAGNRGSAGAARLALCRKTIEGSRIRQEMGVIVLAIKGEDSHMRFNPAPDEVIRAGDHLIAMGEPVGLRRLEDTATERA